MGPYGFTGGLFVNDSNLATMRNLPNDMYVDAVNMMLEGDCLTKRKGSASIGVHGGADDVTILGNYQYRSSGAYTNYIIGVSGGKVATNVITSAGAAGSWTDISGALSMITDRKGNTFSLNNIFVITNLKTTSLTPVKWPGTGNVADLGGSPPAGYCGCVASNYAFLGNDMGSNGSRLRWSAVGDPESWPAANYVDFRKDDGDQILAVFPMDDNLLIFKNRSCGKLYLGGTTFGPLTTISETVGIADINGVDRLPDGRIIFIGGDSNAYIYNGSYLENISRRTFPKSSISFGNIFSTGGGNGSATFINVKVYPGATVRRNQVWFCYEDRTNRYIYIYDYVLDIWIGQYTQIQAFSLNVDIFGKLYSGSAAGYGYLQDYASTNSDQLSATTFNSSFTKCVNLYPEGRMVIPASALFPFTTTSFSGSLTYGFYSVNYTTTTNTIYLVLPGTSSGYKRQVVRLNHRGLSASINLTFSENVIGHDWRMEPFYLSDEVII
jgi:hypothetical protein